MAKYVFDENEMYGNAYLTMRFRYPYSQGYVIIPQDRSKEGYRPDFLIKKQIRYNQTTYFKKIIVEVKSSFIITPRHISQINWYSKNHSGKHSFITGKYLIIPSFSDISRVKDLILKSGIQVIRLRGFHRKK